MEAPYHIKYGASILVLWLSHTKKMEAPFYRGNINQYHLVINFEAFRAVMLNKLSMLAIACNIKWLAQHVSEELQIESRHH